MRKGEQTRQEIIRKAAPIFIQKGYSGAALSDLMRATGLEKGARQYPRSVRVFQPCLI